MKWFRQAVIVVLSIFGFAGLCAPAAAATPKIERTTITACLNHFISVTPPDILLYGPKIGQNQTVRM
jgi:hypothetical protein